MVALAAAACGARSSLDDLEASAAGGAGGAPIDPPPSDGGSPPTPTPFSCEGDPSLLPASIVDVAFDLEGGFPGRPSFVAADDHDDVVSMFHTWSQGTGGPFDIHVTTMEPWASWPPTFGAHFSFVHDVGPDFRVESVGQGLVHLLTQHMESPDEHLGFSMFMSAASPSELVDIPVSEQVGDVTPPLEAPLGLTRGYDTPPIACNQGYMGMMGMWSAPLGIGIHAVRMGVWISECSTIAGLALVPGNDIACANQNMVAAAVRGEKSWIVASSSGTDVYGECDDSVSVPTDLIVAKVAWDAPDVVNWTTERMATQRGESAIHDLRLAATADRTFVLVQRSDDDLDLELSRITADFTIEDPIHIGDGEVYAFDLAAIGDGFVVAYAAGPGDQIDVQLYDRDGALRGRSSIAAAGYVSDLSILPAASGNSAIIGWRSETPGGAEVEMTRFDCQGGT